MCRAGNGHVTTAVHGQGIGYSPVSIEIESLMDKEVTQLRRRRKRSICPPVPPQALALADF